MSKTICELNKEDRAEKQENPKYACKKCGSVARKEKNLCKPKKIKDQSEK